MMSTYPFGRPRMMLIRYITRSPNYVYINTLKMFNDLVLLVVGDKPAFMRFSTLPPASTLELVEAILSNHHKIMTTHPEQVYILRSQLMPLIIRSLSDRLSFPVTVRIMRILCTIIRHHLNILPSECEIALGLLNHMLDPEASQLWKRALCLEVFRSIYTDSRLLLAIYSHFDAQDGKKNIFGDNLAAFVRLAIEKPMLIGLGQQSTATTNIEDGRAGVSEHAVAEAGALAGVIGGSVADGGSSTRPVGISMQWSNLKTPCIEHLDKSDPPTLPDTYVYSLVLTCITSVSESLAKFLLPLTVHHESTGKKKNKGNESMEPNAESEREHSGTRRLSRTQSFRRKTIPVNPLDLKEHPAYLYVQTSSLLVNECWPAVLATCSTFLNAALDTEYYRALVRSIQKFTQVAGLLRLSTPRDAFLTTLGKAAVPSNLMLASASSPRPGTADRLSVFSNAKSLLNVDSLVSSASSLSVDGGHRSQHDVIIPSLGSRNLLCLRALINLAIALGPTLQASWSIVLETLQAADVVMALSDQNANRTPGGPTSRQEQDGGNEKFEAETSAVQAAAQRLFESTVDFPNESFSEFLRALCSLLNGPTPSETTQRPQSASNRPQVLHQRRLGSVSGISLNTSSNPRNSSFVLNKIGDLAALNESRLARYDPDESGWTIFVTEIVRFSVDGQKAASTRLLSADILSRTVRDIAELSMSDEKREDIQARVLAALHKQIGALYCFDADGSEGVDDTDVRVHQIALEALRSVIEHCGESLVAGWGSVIDSLMSVFSARESSSIIGDHKPAQMVSVISRSLARSAFATANLICSDFMAAVPDVCLSTLLNLLLRFCSQQEDLNMSLTVGLLYNWLSISDVAQAITFFWNVSDYLQSRSDFSLLTKMLGSTQQQEEVRCKVIALSEEGHIPALWLQVLLDLSTVTIDHRAEVRNSAIQTTQRIFENYVEQLSPDTWLLCLRVVLLGMMRTNLETQRNALETSRSPQETKEWDETTKVVLQTVAVLNTIYMEKLDASQVSSAWSELLDYLQQYFEFGSHALAACVFTTITRVLSHTNIGPKWNDSSMLKTATVWKSYFDSRDKWQAVTENNQEAFVAYVDAFLSLYRLADTLIVTELPPMLESLEVCITHSDTVSYSSDIDNMTTLQTRVMESMAMLKTENTELPSYVIRLLSRFILLPYASGNEELDKRRPTFVALSKASMSLLQQVITRHIEQEDIYISKAFLSALNSLATPIREKYAWHREGKSPTLWQKATTVAIAILTSGLPHLKSNKDIWAVVVEIAHYITRAQLDPSLELPSSLDRDAAFDMASFKALRDLITLPLGSPSLPDTLRRTYTRNLFSTSLIHTPLPGELPDLTRAPLTSLYHTRLGQTADLETTPRPDLSCLCTSELFTLVNVHDDANETATTIPHIKLAQAAAPYLILRAALPLKTYIADHPLRGRMPAPESQRRELLFVLDALATLRSVPQAIPDAPGVESRYRKHLQRLYPLLLKAARVARWDTEVFERVSGLLEVVGEEFGLEEREA